MPSPQGTPDPERVLTEDGRTVLVSVPLFDQMEAEVASLRAELEQLRPVVRAARLVVGLYESTPLHEDELETARVEVLTDALDALTAALRLALDREAQVREENQKLQRGTGFLIAAAGGEIRVPRRVLLHDYTVTRRDDVTTDDITYTAALRPNPGDNS